MKRFIVRRIISGILTVLVVFTLNFALVKSAPGDPITSLMGKETDDPVLREALMEKWGLDQPVPVQYFNYLKNALTGDLGTLLGIFCARHDGSILDNTLSTISYATDAMPSFWLGLMLIILFATKLDLFPSQGMYNVRAGYTGFRYVLDVLDHLALPCITLVLVTMSGYFRITKSSILQVTNEDFITTMRATGMSERKIFNKYIFRNAILPTVTMLGISIAFLVTGVSLIEIVFSWPGIGSMTLTAINQRDYQRTLRRSR